MKRLIAIFQTNLNILISRKWRRYIFLLIGLIILFFTTINASAAINEARLTNYENSSITILKPENNYNSSGKQKILELNLLPNCNMLSPQINCVSVLPNGNVTITWTNPIVTAVFDSYHIFRSNAPGGPFTDIDSIAVSGQTTYTDLTANANAAPIYYYIETRCTGFEYSPAIDTVSSIYLKVVNPLNGTAVLSWNPITFPNISTSSGIYNIYQEYPTGVWTLIGSITSTPPGLASYNFIDTIYVCNFAGSTINFKVEIADNSGCTSVSSIQGGVFQNKISPATPLFDTLSVDNFNKSQMSWNISPTPDVEAYVIYKFNGTAFIKIDTILGIDSTSYNYLLSTAGSASEQYRIAAYDTCGNLSQLSAVFGTIYLTSTPDICNHSATLNWTASYPSISANISNYRIYQSTVGTIGPYTLIGTVPAGTLTYTASGLLAATTYYYKIQATDVTGTKTASSNKIRFYSASPAPPKFLYLRKVTVISPNQVDITCHVDTTTSTSKYIIMRSLDTVSANYIHIGTVPAGGTSTIFYSDLTALTNKNSYYYKVISVDSCGHNGLQSNLGRTILLTAMGNSSTLTNTLTWNDYESWSGNVLSYNIYRGVDGVMDSIPIANVPYSALGINTYTDDVSMINGEGVFNYYIEALEGKGNIYGFMENSLSNIAEAYQDPRVYIPNAFTPQLEINRIFIPVTVYVDLTEYEFKIFNRWGLEVFITNNLAQGWDGTYKGEQCESAVYVYLLHYKSSRGEYFDLNGIVALLR